MFLEIFLYRPHHPTSSILHCYPPHPPPLPPLKSLIIHFPWQHLSRFFFLYFDLLDRNENCTVFKILMHELKQSQILNMLNRHKFGFQNLTPNLYRYCFLFSPRHSSPPMFILPNVAKTRLLN